MTYGTKKENDMKIGFTGTREGMTRLQRAFVIRAVGMCHVNEVHHGGCVGADEDFHRLSLVLNIPVHVHFGCNSQGKTPSKMEETTNVKGKTIKVYEPRPYLKRDKTIVDNVEMLIATPKGHKEELRSGTWATIRYAKKKNKKILIVYPDGTYYTN